jgi:hypothetical protein
LLPFDPAARFRSGRSRRFRHGCPEQKKVSRWRDGKAGCQDDACAENSPANDPRLRARLCRLDQAGRVDLLVLKIRVILLVRIRQIGGRVLLRGVQSRPVRQVAFLNRLELRR